MEVSGSVLEYGTYLEGMVKVIHYDAMHHDTYKTYIDTLNHLRVIGCTITPKAYIPARGTMWIYGPTSHEDIEAISLIREHAKLPEAQPTRIQIIASLLNMYDVGFDFNLTTYDDLTSLVTYIMACDKIAMSTPVKALDTYITVFNVEYCMISSAHFDNPIVSINRGNTYTCLRLAAYLLITL